MSRAVVHFKSAETMPEIPDKLVRLFIGGSVFFEGDATWDPYEALYQKVYNTEAHRVLADDGVFVVVQTNSYKNGKFMCKYAHLFNMLSTKWDLVDERVWVRRAADHFQVPFSHVLIFKKKGAAAPTRKQLNEKSKEWFQGVWQYPQRTYKGMSQLNSWPDAMAGMILTACTEPGDVVVDAFAGGGSFLAYAAKLGRVGFGYEIDPECVPLLRSNGVSVRGFGD